MIIRGTISEENITKWGIIGTARIAEQEIIPALNQSDIAELYAVASRNGERAEAYARKNNIPNSYGSYEDMLSVPEIEIIYNPLPNSLHKKWTIKAANAGKNILCEKPLALSPEGAEEMFDACDSNNVLLMEGFMYRFHPQTRRVKEFLEEGIIGEPKLIRASHSFPLINENRPDDHRWKQEMGGGSLMDLGCYCVSTCLHFFAEEPNEAFASAVYHPDHSAEAQLEGVLEFPDGKKAIIDSSFLLSLRRKYEIVSEKGSIRATKAYYSEGEDVTIEIYKGDTEEVETIEGVNEYRLEVDSFTRAVKNGKNPEITREDSVGNMRTINSLYKSASKNETVEV